MSLMYVDLLDQNKIVTKNFVAVSRKQWYLQREDTIPPELYGKLGVAPLSSTEGDGPRTGKAVQSNGKWVVEVLPLTTAQKIERIEVAIQEHLNGVAKGLGYYDIHSTAKYQGAPNPFQAESCALGAWAGNCWATSYAMLQDYQDGVIPEPTEAEVIAALPAYVAP